MKKVFLFEKKRYLFFLPIPPHGEFRMISEDSSLETKKLISTSSRNIIVELLLEFCEDRYLIVDLDVKTWQILDLRIEH